MDQEVKASEPFDLNRELSEEYERWERLYLGGVYEVDPKTKNLCCIAFSEGARAIQSLMKTALIEVLSERKS